MSCNMFAYCNNNPVCYYDPYGLRLQDGSYHDFGNGVIGYTDTGTGGKSENDDNNSKSFIGFSKLDNYPDHPDYKPPKNGPRKVKNPNGKGNGWEAKDGGVWIWTPNMHGGEGWTIQYPGGGHSHAYPGGGVRYSFEPVYSSPSIGVYLLAGILIVFLLGDDLIGIVEDEPLLSIPCAIVTPEFTGQSRCSICGEYKNGY